MKSSALTRYVPQLAGLLLPLSFAGCSTFGLGQQPHTERRHTDQAASTQEHTAVSKPGESIGTDSREPTQAPPCQPVIEYRDRVVYQDRIVHQDRPASPDVPASSSESGPAEATDPPPTAQPAPPPLSEPAPPTSSASDTTSIVMSPFEAVTVEHCYDGDTCTVGLPGLPSVFGEHLHIRLADIDTPEKRGRCEREKELAQQAQQFLETLLARARRIQLQDPRRDKYFRLLARVVADGQDLSEALIQAGFAVRYNGGTKASWCDTIVPPPASAPVAPEP